MHFPKFWARGTHEGYTCWGWSEKNIEEALRSAHASAKKLAARFQGKYPDKSAQYHWYADRPLREEVLQEIKAQDGTVSACITRNSYGALVLNTRGVMFLDIDFNGEQKSASLFGLVKSLFGNKSDSPSEETRVLGTIKTWCQRNSSWGLRVYRTANGLRLLATHQLFEPERILQDRICEELGVDPLYRKLCVAQKSFRARLTPKPWRCNLSRAPSSWPWLDEKSEQSFRNWEKSYARESEAIATCKFLEAFGAQSISSDVKGIMELHDTRTKSLSGLPLA